MVSAVEAALLNHQPAGEALTVEEARKTRATVLKLANSRLSSIPEGLGKLKSVAVLDLHQNPLSQSGAELPPNLKELNLVGCGLSKLPKATIRLMGLEQLHLGGNKLDSAEEVFRCPKLMHAGLSYNHISQLPASLSTSQIFSLDLSHNHLCDLTATTSLLAQLPNLASLSLSGNPFCLLPSYQPVVRSTFPSLVFLDGHKVDSVASSRPCTATSAPPALLAQLGDQSFMAAHDTYLEVVLEGCKVLEDPFAQVKAQRAAASQQAGPAGQAALQPPAPPLRPTYYHIEMQDSEGTLYASIPLAVHAPEPLQSTGADAAKKDVKKAAEAGAGKAGAGAKGKDMEPPGGAGVLQRGCLRMTLALNADVATRDWLRKGLSMKLYRTRLTAVLKAPPATPPPPAAQPAKGKPATKAPEPQVLDLSLYDITSETSLAGQGSVHTEELVSGSVFRHCQTISIIPEPRLWDEKGLRMGLKDPRHSKEPIVQLQAAISLHVLPLEVQQ